MKILKCVIPLILCAVFASCGANNSNSVSTPDHTTAEVSTTDETTVSQQENQSEETNISGYPEFDFDTKTVTLNSGYEMPILGIGCFSLSDEEAENSVFWALSDGYRLIDTARIYGNEEAVERGIKRAIDEGIVTREKIFVTTKMWTSDYEDGEAAVQASLDKLGLDYIDLMILHHSQPENDVQAYQAMEKAVGEGKLR